MSFVSLASLVVPAFRLKFAVNVSPLPSSAITPFTCFVPWKIVVPSTVNVSMTPPLKVVPSLLMILMVAIYSLSWLEFFVSSAELGEHRNLGVRIAVTTRADRIALTTLGRGRAHVRCAVVGPAIQADE